MKYVIYKMIHLVIGFFSTRKNKDNRLRKSIRSIGAGVSLNPTLEIMYPEKLRIGSYVHMGTRVSLNARGGLSIGDYSVIAAETAIITAEHNYKNAKALPYDEVVILNPVVIERCVWIGMRCLIMPGISIGEGSIVGAGSVVTKSCSPGAIIAGNPAKIIAQRDMNHYYKLVQDKKFYMLLKESHQLSNREIIN